MSDKKWNSLKLGALLGVLLPLLVMIGIFFWKFSFDDIQTIWHQFYELELFSKFLSVCVYPNLLLFFIFIWRNLLLSARGVLLSTIILAFLVLIIKFAI